MEACIEQEEHAPGAALRLLIAFMHMTVHAPPAKVQQSAQNPQESSCFGCVITICGLLSDCLCLHRW